MRLFDSHTHIQDAAFDADREEVIERAWQAGLVAMLVLGTNVTTTEKALALAEKHPQLLVAAGCHPHYAEDMDDASLDRVAELAADPRIAAVGETGIDFYRDLSPRDRQIAVFQRHLEIAADLGKPIAIHCREAHDVVMSMIEPWSKRLGGALPGGRPLGVMHYFSGQAALAQYYVDFGFAISIHCSVTYPSSDRLAEVARRLPLETLLVETDSPYGAPQSRRGQRNEPALVAEAVQHIAELRGEPVERVAEATTENAFRLFGISGAQSTQPIVRQA